jgi:hypothetical protein
VVETNLVAFDCHWIIINEVKPTPPLLSTATFSHMDPPKGGAEGAEQEARAQCTA